MKARIFKHSTPMKTSTDNMSSQTQTTKFAQAESQHFASIIESPLGRLWIRHNQHSIFQLQYISDTACDISLGLVNLASNWENLLACYFSGNVNALNQLPISLDIGTPFQQEAWLALAHIPAGKTSSYLQLAQQINRPKAVRAVGQALKRNPLAIILPCHRIIQQSGKLGGYAGQTQIGTERKLFLLQHEGIILNR